MSSGYVYVLKNRAFRSVKIGCTTKTPEERAAELSGTSTPHPFKVAYSVTVDNCRAIERQVHEYFAEQRVSDKREFFWLSVEDAIAGIKEIVAKADYRPEMPVTPTPEPTDDLLRLTYHPQAVPHNTHIPTNRYAEEIVNGPANLSLGRYYPHLYLLLAHDDALLKHIHMPGNFGRLKALHKSQPEYLEQAERKIRALIKAGYQRNKVPRGHIHQNNEIEVPLNAPDGTGPVYFWIGDGTI